MRCLSVRGFFTATAASGCLIAALGFDAVHAQTPTATQTPPPGAVCVGDCDGDRIVLVNEIQTLVNVALERADATACAAGREQASAAVTVDELVTAVSRLLHGCAPRAPTPPLGPFANGRCSETSGCDPCDVYPCRPSGVSAEFCCRLRAGGGTYSWCEVVDAAGFCAKCGDPCRQ